MTILSHPDLWAVLINERKVTAEVQATFPDADLEVLVEITDEKALAA